MASIKLAIVAVLFGAVLGIAGQLPAQSSPCEEIGRATRPGTIRTPRGATITYDYNFQTGTFAVRWGKGKLTRGPSPSYQLTGGCEPAYVEWENDHFIVMRIGCGSPCWYAIVLPLGRTTAPETIYYPLAFDSAHSLLATVGDDTLLEVRNLRTKRVQRLAPQPPCSSVFPGWCVDEITFAQNRLQVRWRTWSDNQAERSDDLIFQLEPTLLRKE